MTTPSVHLEVLSVPNKTPYEKSLIGQLFAGDGKDLSAKTKSPMLLRVKANLQPEPKGDKLHTKLEVRQPDMRSKTPEPESTSPPPTLQSGQDSQERVSQTEPESTTRASPTPKAHSQSPLAARNPIISGLPNLTTKKGGKRIKIDLKKGNCRKEIFYHCYLFGTLASWRIWRYSLCFNFLKFSYQENNPI